MSADNKYSVQDLIDYSVLQKPVEFADTFNNLLLDRISTNIQDIKTSLAQRMFNPEHQNETEYTEDN